MRFGVAGVVLLALYRLCLPDLKHLGISPCEEGLIWDDSGFSAEISIFAQL